MLFGRREQFPSMPGDHVFVGRHHMLAVLQRRQHQAMRRFLASQEFDHDLNFRIVQNLRRVGRQLRVAVNSPRLFQIPHQNLFDLQIGAGLAGHHRGIGLENLHYSAADRAEPEQPDLNCLVHNQFPLSLRPGRALPAASRLRSP